MLKYENLKQKNENEMKSLYSKRVDGDITVDEFKLQYDLLKNKVQEIDKTLCDLKEQNKNNISEERLKDIIINFKAGRKFDNEIMKELISRIDVYENKKIEITFNF